jgi:shikimate dehydrogenase
MRAVSPTTALCGIVLHPVGHTRSPAMHNAAFEALNLDAAYLAFDVREDQLGAAIAGARALGIRQLAVSIPHKMRVMEHLDEIEETAQAIGAVNTLTRRGDRLVGDNTDWRGAMRALEREGELAGAHAVVLGAGGTARALTYGLLQKGAQVTVLNRTPARAERLARDLGAKDAGPLESLKTTPHDILVNTTSVGLQSNESPVPAGALRENTIVMDAVYAPTETRLLSDAKQAGAKTVAGKWMLVYQAALQLELWSNQQAPIEVMSQAFDQAGHQSGQDGQR